jgi:hypothetical protein
LVICNFEIRRRETGRLHLADQRQAHKAVAVDRELTAQIVLAIDDDANLVSGSQVIIGIGATMSGAASAMRRADRSAQRRPSQSTRSPHNGNRLKSLRNRLHNAHGRS